MSRYGKAALATSVALAFAAPASASVTIGSTTPPASGPVSEVSCSLESYFVEPLTDPSVSFGVPNGGGAITSWQTAIGGADEPGNPLTLVVLQPGANSHAFTVTGLDTETLPDLSVGEVASFNVNPPLPVRAGDLLGFYQGPESPGADCLYSDPDAVFDSVLFDANAPAPMAGEGIATTQVTPPGDTLNLAATLDNDVDASVTAGAGPAHATVGSIAELTAEVTNGGPAIGPIVFTDTVPVGLTIDSAVAGEGHCSASGQIVTCTLDDLAPGASAPVVVVVTPTAAGRYGHTASVSVDGFTDPNSANNTAGATLTVAPATTASPPKCHVPPLAGTSAKLAKQLLGLLDCRVGKTRTAPSKRVAKGLVISTTPGSGKTLAAGTKVALTVSSGRPKRKHSRR
jgi:uncharacterized protein DUF11/PASTA domain-containing protein